MCGIVGIVSPHNEVVIDELGAMTNSLLHRGPDGYGHWVNQKANVGLGHRRLSIIDLSESGKQPMQFANERYTISFNGEIYNYLELKQFLIEKGYSFKSDSDTEVLLALFHEKKEDCLSYLDGMFAFAIWDEKEKILFCARDRFGEKPFYYTLHNGVFYFASEMKALWQVGVPKITNESMLFNYLAFGNEYNPQDLSETFFVNIRKLKASHYFFISPENLSSEQTQYWKINYQEIDSTITEKQASEKFRELFTQSVSRRLRADVPVGSSLSGGLDSSLIVCLIDSLNKERNLRQATFSARFPDFAKDEGKFMQMVIDNTIVEPYFVYPNEEGLIKSLDDLFYHQEEPFGSASIYAQYCVMKLAKENNVTVLLDGQGADEILAGYHSYFPAYFKELGRKNKSVQKDEIRSYQHLHPNSPLNSYFQKSIKNLVSKNLPVGLKSYWSKARAKKNLYKFFNKDFFETYIDSSYIFQLEPSNSLAESLFQSCFGGDLEVLLRYADRNSMAHSREVRLPFLNHELVEFLFTLPSNLKLKSGVTKYILRESFSNILPKGIVTRYDKIGYEPPQSKWLQQPQMVDKITEALEKLNKSSVLNKKLDSSIFGDSLKWKVLNASFLK